MAWLILVLSAVAEAVWASALGDSDGFSRPVPTVVFAVFVTLSMIGLAWAMRRIPLGTAYAVWVGLGAALTVSWAAITGNETLTVGKVIFLVGIVGAVVGLKFVGHDEPATSSDNADEPATSSDNADEPATSSADTDEPATSSDRSAEK